MTPEKARERILASSRFHIVDRKVLVRDTTLLDLLQDVRNERPSPRAITDQPAHS